MAFAGIAVTFAGFVIAVASLGATNSNTARLGIVVVGICVSLFGSIGLLNGAFAKKAVWKK